MFIKNLKQFINFCFVGASIAVIDFGLTFVLKELFGIDQYFSNTVALVVAIVTKFFFHRYWVFKEEADTNKAREHTKFIKFIIVNSVGVGINNGVIYLLSFVKIYNPYWFYISKVLATGIVMLWNFFANKFWTFKRHTHEEPKI